MNVSEFISTLERNPNKVLYFSCKGKFKVVPFYHITEIKCVRIDAVDCGGKQNRKYETVMQLWAGVDLDDGHRITAHKALSLMTKVDQKTALVRTSPLLIEYGDNNGVVQYHLSLKKISHEGVYFEIKGIQSQCKAIGAMQSCCSDVVCCS